MNGCSSGRGHESCPSKQLSTANDRQPLAVRFFVGVVNRNIDVQWQTGLVASSTTERNIHESSNFEVALPIWKKIA